MFLLDTNIVSELRKVKIGKADPNVVAWAQSILSPTLFVSVITIMEIEVGVLLAGRRELAQGETLRTWLTLQVLPAFENRILPVDTDVARACARMHVPDRRPDRDALIAATAIVHNLTVATRNVADFAAPDVAVVNPWERRSSF